MTRIVAGFAGSLTLTVPATGTRPTSERVREAIFSALEARDAIAGCRVLDLYAGSGALGLEAASRGAAHVTLVENSKTGVRVCRTNAALIEAKAPRGSDLRIEVAGQSVHTFLTGSSDAWDLVLVDPPYELGGDELAANLEALVPRLRPDATVVLERATRSPAPVLPVGLELERRKVYGDTTLYWVGVV
ncbi:MAG: 16S rRNA (guanine(966)-N(2))-methyltransferase RsmD [Microbacteriaceae bacterium]